jgi:hypothetical protein
MQKVLIIIQFNYQFSVSNNSKNYLKSSILKIWFLITNNLMNIKKYYKFIILTTLGNNNSVNVFQII